MKLATAFRQMGYVTVSEYSKHFHGKVTYAFEKEEFYHPAFISVRSSQTGRYEVYKVTDNFIAALDGETGGEELLRLLGRGQELREERKAANG